MEISKEPIDGMFVEVRSKLTGLLIGTRYICEVCRKDSPLVKADKDGKTKLPASWTRFSKVPTVRRRGRFSIVYCAKCETCTNREIVESERTRPGCAAWRTDG